MSEILENDKTLIVEMLSVLAFFSVGVALIFSTLLIDTRINNLVWILVVFTIAILQYVGVAYKNDIKTLRVCMAWCAGSLWSWFSLINTHTILFLPTLLIGIFNLYAFYVLVNDNDIDWEEFLQGK